MAPCRKWNHRAVSLVGPRIDTEIAGVPEESRTPGGHRRPHLTDYAVPSRPYRDVRRAQSSRHSRRPRKRSCDSMTDSSSCARSNPARPATAVVVDSALRRRYPVSCALQVGDGVLPRLRPRAFLARSLRRPPGEDGRLELLPSRHRATPIIPADPANHILGAAS